MTIRCRTGRKVTDPNLAGLSLFRIYVNVIACLLMPGLVARPYQQPSIGRSWKAFELRLKSWDDLNKIWFVLLKEKNMLMTQRRMLQAQNIRFPNPERLPKF